VQARLPGLPAVLKDLLSDGAMRLVAIRGLSGYEDAAAANAILAGYRGYNSEEQNEAIATLSSRPTFVLALLSAVKAARVPARDITPFAARQMLAHKDSRIDAQLTSIFGQSRAISPDKTAKIAEYRRLLTKQRLASADLAAGRVAFNRTCGGCHTLFGEGGTLAPELTGSHRSNMEYILDNVVDPSAIVWNQYKTTYFETADDRVISGVVVAENEQSVTIQTQTGTVILPLKEITTRTQSNVSIMPEGLFDTLEEQELVNLVAYLQSPTPVGRK
jgi:putative heme-binding domain-containing protein